MKKLILLAVVVMGFAATSFAQNVASAGINGQVQLPAPPPAFTVSWMNDMDLGIITNRATLNQLAVWNDPTAAVLEILPSGTIPAPVNLTYTGLPRPARFLCKNALTDVTLNDLVLGGFSDHTIAGGHVWFDTNIFSQANPVIANTNPQWTPQTGYTSVTTNGAGQWIISVGGRIQLDKQATGNINLAGITVTVNGH